MGFLLFFQPSPPELAKDHILKSYLCTFSESRALDVLWFAVANTWLTPWVLGVAMVRQTSWRASVHNKSILAAPCLSHQLVLLRRRERCGCLWILQWGPTCLATGLSAAVSCRNFWTLDRLHSVPPLHLFPRLDFPKAGSLLNNLVLLHKIKCLSIGIGIRSPVFALQHE